MGIIYKEFFGIVMREKEKKSLSGTVEDIYYPNRNASDSVLGMNFQVAAGIRLMLCHIKKLEKLKIEGRYDDIELVLSDGVVYAQAKAVRERDNRSGTTTKLNEALTTLSEDAERDGSTSELIYITNILNPFSSSSKLDQYCPYYDKVYGYYDLVSKQRDVVDKYVKPGFPVEKFKVYIVDFFGDGNSKYDSIKKDIEMFLSRTEIPPSYAQLLLEKWVCMFFSNGADESKEYLKLHLSKIDLMNPVITQAVSSPVTGNAFENVDEELDYDEIAEEYKSVIRKESANYTFVSSVISRFQKECKNKSAKERRAYRNEFIQTFCVCEEYTKYFDTAEERKRKGVVELAMLTVLTNSSKIEGIREAANL